MGNHYEAGENWKQWETEMINSEDPFTPNPLS